MQITLCKCTVLYKASMAGLIFLFCLFLFCFAAIGLRHSVVSLTSQTDWFF